MIVTGVTTRQSALASGAPIVFVGESGTVRVHMGYPPGMDTAAGSALQEEANLQFGSDDWRAEYGRYGREPVFIEVAEEGIQEVVHNAKEILCPILIIRPHH